MARRSLRAYSNLNDGNMDNEEEDGLVSDTTDGQHILENLGLESKNLSESPKVLSSVTRLQRQKYLWIILVLLLAIILGYVYTIQGEESSDVQYEPEERILKMLIPKTKKLIAQRKNTWYQILTGLTNLMRPPVSPAVYLLLSDENSRMASSCVAEIITTVADGILRGNKKWLFLNGTELSKAISTDPGILIESVSEEMSFSKVLVVSDIHKIPGSLAAGFHFLVDQENPKIRDAVYVFTITIDGISTISKPLNSVEKILYKSWNNLSTNILHPLVTRVTEAVLHIVQEKGIGECPLKTHKTREIRIP